MRSSSRGGCTLLLFLSTCLPLAAQSPTADSSPLGFDVVSIRSDPSNGTAPSNRRMLPGGRFVATGTSVRTLLRIAFATDDDRISGAPAWTATETFDIDAIVAGHVDINTPEQFEQLIFSLLADRFQLQFHRQQREGPIYRLETERPGKLGPALQPSAAGTQTNMSSNSNGARAELKVSSASMGDIAAALRRAAGRPIEDHTGVAGRYDFQIKWAPDETADSADPSLFTVLKEQLGLKLQPAKGPVETIVIDHIAHPSAN